VSAVSALKECSLFDGNHDYGVLTCDYDVTDEPRKVKVNIVDRTGLKRGAERVSILLNRTRPRRQGLRIIMNETMRSTNEDYPFFVAVFVPSTPFPRTTE